MRGWVPRWRRVRYAGSDQSGRRFARSVQGFHARVVQHECDHLDGILYPQRMTDMTMLVFSEELRHGAPKGAPGIGREEAAALAEG
jgi:peptide deformylase